MGEINYASLVAELIKPVVTHPEDVNVTIASINNDSVKVVVSVNQNDLGRVIGKKGRVAGYPNFFFCCLIPIAVTTTSSMACTSSFIVTLITVCPSTCFSTGVYPI